MPVKIMAEPNNTPLTGDPITPPAATAVPATNPPAQAAPTQTQEVKVYDADYVKDLRSENASYRTKAKDFETQLGEATKTIETLRETTKSAALRASVAVEAIKLKIVDADAALALMDKAGVKFNDDGTIEGVTDALTKLIEAKPYLVGESAQATPSGNPPRDEGIKKRSEMSYAEKTAYTKEHGHEKYLQLPA